MSPSIGRLVGTRDPLGLVVSRFGEQRGLSSRECQILLLAAQGLADKEISGKLNLAYTT